MIYFLVAISLVLLSIRYDICEKTKGRNECYLVVLIVIILIAGLRWRVGGDTTRYLGAFYNNTPLLWDLSPEDLPLGGKPLWKLLMSFIYTIGGKFFWIQIIESAFFNILLLMYIKKHCQFIFTCVFFYFISQYLLMNTEVMKAAFSIVICLYANDFFLEKKWIKAYALVAIAALFHPQAILFALTPLFLFLKINRTSLLILFCSFFVGYAIQISIGDYLDMLEYIGDDAVGDKLTSYSNSDYVESRSLKWQLLNTYPLILYSIVGVYFFKKRPIDQLLKLQPFFIMGLVYQIMSLQVYIIYRVADAYKIYVLMFIANMVVSTTKDCLHVQKQVSLFRSFVLFLPLIISLLFNTMIRNRVKYFPYTSVFNREIIAKRELHVHSEPMASYSVANKSQY
ncbi:MAG: EpsG family protein [Prevotella sp.]|nr:EpsG family protein [Prevotella sp.]